MGNRSKLTPKQWDEIQKRILDGESTRSIAKEFKISETAIRKRLGSQTKQIKSVANQLVKSEEALRELPIGSQVFALNFAEELRSISMHLASSAKYGAATSHRLSGIAHETAMLVDDATPLEAESIHSLKGIAILTKLANDSAAIGLNLLSSNKDTVKQINDAHDPQVFEPVEVVIVDASRGQ